MPCVLNNTFILVQLCSILYSIPIWKCAFSMFPSNTQHQYLTDRAEQRIEQCIVELNSLTLANNQTRPDRPLSNQTNNEIHVANVSFPTYGRSIVKYLDKKIKKKKHPKAKQIFVFSFVLFSLFEPKKIGFFVTF